mgnify:CR=1 FL=1
MDEKENKIQDLKDLKPTFMEKNERSHKTIVKDKLNIVDEDKAKGMIKKRQKSSKDKIMKKICRKLELKIEIEKDGLKSRETVNKGWKNNNDNLKEKIDERLI